MSQNRHFALGRRWQIAEGDEAGARAEQHFARLYGRRFVLDIEFKLTPNRQIVFKQARPYAAR